MANKTVALTETIEQEIDFIGQLFVEFEQLQSYPDVLKTEDNLRTLASLYYDYIDRLNHILLHLELPGIKAGGLQNLSLLLSDATIRRINPLIQFYIDYKDFYPDKLAREKITDIYHLLPKATEFITEDLRNFSNKQD